MEAHQVQVQQTVEPLAAPGDDGEDVGRRKGGVEEERDGEVGAPLLDQLGREHQVEVVHPHEPPRAAFAQATSAKSRFTRW